MYLGALLGTSFGDFRETKYGLTLIEDFCHFFQYIDEGRPSFYLFIDLHVLFPLTKLVFQVCIPSVAIFRNNRNLTYAMSVNLCTFH